MRQGDRGYGRGTRMIIVYACTVFLFLYLVYALMHPEKF
ncbi:K(+)-transporting ATPase subunit F [Paenibacillus flagellatus]|uniref:K(+)-transporting ATPase subunit F n=1 Tax=Paenibacillus flagellatus TaxID=2211139 RepID=A0A2V5KRL9_9BACL|nr:K(+)-transporting ATPase subunit F [Paenibacillus flagellatus]